MTIKEFQSLTKDEQQAALLAMKPGPRATADERARFEMLRRIALGHTLTAEEQAGIEAGEMYNSLKKPQSPNNRGGKK